MQEISILLLKVLRHAGTSVDYFHKVLVLDAVVSVEVSCQAVHCDVVKVLLKEKFPLVHGLEFLLSLYFLLYIVHDMHIISTLHCLHLCKI